MKNKAIFLFILLSCITLVAQDDDYCSCMEADNSHDNLANLLTNHQTAINIWQTPSHQFQRQQIIVPPKEEIVPITIVTEALIKEDSINKLESLIQLEPIAEGAQEEIQEELSKEKVARTTSYSSKKTNGKAKVKRKLKRLKGKVKKRKKMRKYKGRCPGF